MKRKSRRTKYSLATSIVILIIVAALGFWNRIQAPNFDLTNIPDFSDTPYVEVNGNVPYFTQDDITTDSYETYSPLDALGRCGVVMSCIGQDLMPTEERGNIGQVKPSGWQTVKYDFVNGKYLYNRCHLIGFQLTGENANTCNLITGTRYMNMEGMLPFENMVADYIKETNNHVLYRVTPIFQDDELVARGVLIEAKSVEDDGDGILFCVYVYNNQPGVEIDYLTGLSKAS
ncbi:MAG: DNA/RNA non-specific endonuclease [Oscillospiraceae bacterium]|nr:DNA/RNA non-specific endonuclease [Oscillospiraceae bacterium]